MTINATPSKIYKNFTLFLIQEFLRLRNYRIKSFGWAETGDEVISVVYGNLKISKTVASDMGYIRFIVEPIPSPQTQDPTGAAALWE